MPKKRKRQGRQRRARGTGSIYYDARRGVWVGRVPVGRGRTGRTLYREASAPTQSELVLALRGLEPPGPDTTVREWAERWFASLSIRPSSLGDYRHTLDNFILPTFGPRRVADLTAHDIEAAAREWSRRLGPNTLRKNLGHFRACLEGARRAKLIPDNPVKDARKPKGKRPRIDPFTPAELARIIDAASHRPLDTLFALLAATGLRLGEALALDVADYDPAAGTVRVTKTYSRKHGIRPPKSENGVRTLEVPKDARPALALARGVRKAGPLFPAERGTDRRQHNTVRWHWKRFLGRLGYRYRNPHQLRHSVASAWIAAGVGVGDVARDLGDSVQTVVNTYIHPSGANTARVMETVLKRGRSVGANGADGAKSLKSKAKTA